MVFLDPALLTFTLFAALAASAAWAFFAASAATVQSCLLLFSLTGTSVAIVEGAEEQGLMGCSDNNNGTRCNKRQMPCF